MLGNPAKLLNWRAYSQQVSRSYGPKTHEILHTPADGGVVGTVCTVRDPVSLVVVGFPLASASPFSLLSTEGYRIIARANIEQLCLVYRDVSFRSLKHKVLESIRCISGQIRQEPA